MNENINGEVVIILEYFALHEEMETNFESMEIKIAISKLLYMERYKAAALKLESLKNCINCKNGSNYQYVIFTKAVIDYSLGKINKQEYLAELYYAIHITRPSYKVTKRPKGLLTRQETLIIINITLFYRRTGQKSLAFKMLSQLAVYYRKNNINFEQNAAALIWINLSELLEEMGAYKEGAEVAEEGFNLELKYTKGTFLNRLWMSIGRNIGSLEKESQYLKDGYQMTCSTRLFEIM